MSEANSETPGVLKVGDTTYMPDGQGKLVPIGLVEERHKLEDSVARSIFGKAQAQGEQLKAFKAATLDEVEAYIALVAEQYDAKAAGAKGNMTIKSYDGLIKVIVAVSPIQGFGPELQIAKSLVDEFIESRSANIDAELKVLLFDAFDVDQQGKLNRSRLFALLRLDIKDPVWVRAMKALKDSITVEGSSQYFRFYHRASIKDAWKPVSLDLATA